MTATVLRVICMYCKFTIGYKDGRGVSGDSHSICSKCWEKRFPDWEYPTEKDAKEATDAGKE